MSYKDESVLRALKKQGKRDSEIAEMYGVDASTVSGWRRKFGIPRLPRGRHPKHPSIAKSIRRMKAQGLSDQKIGQVIGLSQPQVSYWRCKLNIPRCPTPGNRKYTLNIDFFASIETQEQAYVLGLLATDGSVHSNGSGVYLALSKTDAHLLQDVLDVLESNAPILIKKKPNTESGWSTNDLNYIGIFSTKMVADLAKYGIVPNKVYSLQYPDHIPDHLHRHFIRGLWDGDGFISKDQFGLCGTESLLSSTREIILAQTSVAGRAYQGKGNYFRLCYGRKGAPVLTWFYENSTIHLRRKYRRFLKHWA